MSAIPRAPGFDNTLALLRDPYRFISATCRDLQSDIFITRILLSRTICLRGAAAAALFYGSSRLTRRGAAPLRIQKTLVGRGGVQGLDDEAHQRRKRMFLSLMTPERISELGRLVHEGLLRRARSWAAAGGEVMLYEELRELLMRAVCAWAGVPLAEEQATPFTRQVAALYEHAGGVGPRHWQARWARRRSERWMRGIILDIRAGRLHPSASGAAQVIAFHRDTTGQELPPEVAAVELLNVIRPTVAVAVWLVHAAHALHLHPASAQRIAAGDRQHLGDFVQEVRRWYPFFPAAIARVRESFVWQGHVMPQGCRVLLDLYGTNHDPRIWSDPADFAPERFRSWKEDPYTFIPQGGGDHRANHRCPGEWIAIELMRVAVAFLTGRIAYTVDGAGLEIEYGRMPAMPRRFVIRQVVMRDRTGPE
jgi:fatty-acid peroxygenase